MSHQADSTANMGDPSIATPSAVPGEPDRQRRVPVDGIELAVAEYGPGDGIALVLLHGIGSRGISWFPVIEPLTARGTYRLIIPDLRGHGASDKPEQGYLLPDYAADLQGLIESLGLEHFGVIGHSLGGLTTLRWATLHPYRAAAIVLEDTALAGGPQLRPAFDGWIALSQMSVEEATAAYAAQYPDWSAEDCRRRAESITTVHPNVFVEMRDESTSASRPPRLVGAERILSPVLLIHGDVETGSMVQPRDAQRLRTLLPTLRLAHIPGGSHTLHRDMTNAFLGAVEPFLDEAMRGG